jgi:hypothetical protein
MNSHSHHNHSHNHSHNFTPNSSSSTISFFILMFSTSVHSVFEGKYEEKKILISTQ